MRPRLLLTINRKSHIVDLLYRPRYMDLHTSTAVARLPLRQLGFLVSDELSIPTVVVLCEPAGRLFRALKYNLIHRLRRLLYHLNAVRN